MEIVTVDTVDGVISGGTVTGYMFDGDYESENYGTLGAAAYTFTFEARAFNPDFLVALEGFVTDTMTYGYEVTAYSNNITAEDYPNYWEVLDDDTFSYVGDTGWADFEDVYEEIAFLDQYTAAWTTGTPDSGTFVQVDEYRDEYTDYDYNSESFGVPTEIEYLEVEKDTFTLTFDNGQVSSWRELYIQQKISQWCDDRRSRRNDLGNSIRRPDAS